MGAMVGMCMYRPRVIDATIENRLKNKGAILVEGAKWCGKTTTCEQHAASIVSDGSDGHCTLCV